MAHKRLLAFAFLIWPVLVLYPHGLLQNTYLHYGFIWALCGSVIILTDKKQYELSPIVKFSGILALIVFGGEAISYYINPQIPVTLRIGVLGRFFTLAVFAVVLREILRLGGDKALQRLSAGVLLAYFVGLLIVFADIFNFPVVSLFQVIEKQDLGVHNRAYGPFLSPVSAGIFIMSMIMYLLATLRYDKRSGRKVICCILLFFSFICLFSTASRTAILGSLGGILFFVAIGKNKLIYTSLLVILGIIASRLEILQNYIENIVMRNSEQISNLGGVFKGTGRLDTIENSVELYFSWRTWLFGTSVSEYTFGDTVYSYAHNGFLSILLPIGFFGLLLYFAIFKRYLGISLILIKERSPTSKVFSLYFILFGVASLISFWSADLPLDLFWPFLLFFNIAVLEYLFGERNRYNNFILV